MAWCLGRGRSRGGAGRGSVPARMLSCCLGGGSQGIELKFRIVLRYTPFLGKLGMSNLVSVRGRSCSRLRRVFSKVRVGFCGLSYSRKGYLILFCHPGRLRRCVGRPGLHRLVKRCKCGRDGVRRVLTRLSRHVYRYATRKGKFPRRVKTFLKCPVTSIRDFVRGSNGSFVVAKC